MGHGDSRNSPSPAANGAAGESLQLVGRTLPGMRPAIDAQGIHKSLSKRHRCDPQERWFLILLSEPYTKQLI
jgi:hypothetical protein